MIRHSFLSCCLLLFIRLFCVGQGKLRYLSIDQGLSNNTVTCITKDRQGFMWFGTYDGLNKYDGYTFKKYNHRIGDSTSLADNKVLAMEQDSEGRQWVAAGPGVSVLNDNTSSFTRVKFTTGAHAGARQLESLAYSIINDGQGNMLVGTNEEGLLFFPKGSFTGRNVELVGSGRYTTHYSISTMAKGKDRRIWAYVRNAGICLYDPRSGKLVVQCKDSAVVVNSMVQGVADTLLVGTDQGLYMYNMHDSRLVPFHSSGRPLPGTGRIMHLCLDQSGKLWIATDGNGVKVVDARTHAILALSEALGGQDLTSNAIYDIYEDDRQRKWIGTFRGGVNMIDNGGYDFYSVKRQSGAKNTLVDDFVFSFCEDRSGDIWIGTDGGGISVWDRQKNTFHNYTSKGASGLTNNNIASMIADRAGDVWIATYGGGVVRYDGHRGVFQPVTIWGGSGGLYAWELYEDHAGTIWLGTGKEDKALYRYDAQKRGFVRLNVLTGSITALTGDGHDNIWIGSDDKVQCIDAKGNLLLELPVKASVRSIAVAGNGIIWIGMQGGGLLRYEKGKLRTYDERQGLSNNNVLNILEDKSGSLWISTFNGLSRFFPDRERFENFYDVDGLQSNQFSYNAALRLSSGEMLFGGIKGFTLFRPEACVPKNNFPPIAVTGIRILNEEVKGANPYMRSTASDTPLTIELPYSKAVLSVDFAALEYSLPSKIKYSYLLQGWDKTWSLPGPLKTANYSELREGDYVLRVRSTNASGIWNDQELRIPVIILPPWYRTWWFRLSLVLAVAGMIVVLLAYWEKQRRIQYQIKVSELKHQQDMELNERRLSFFTNISHEFRSPLTMIINPIREILKKGALPEDSFNLNVLYNNAQRLLKMTDQLLMFRRADSEWGEPEMTRLDLLNLCRQVYFCFIEEARLKSLQYLFDCSLENAPVLADQEKMEIILFNLISNAIKFSPSGRKVLVRLEEQEGIYMVSVRDEGPGIPADIGEKLFSKFYQVPGSRASTSTKGFGIGLFLAKSLTDLHNGKLTHYTPSSGGAVFELSLPKAAGDQADIPGVGLPDLSQHSLITAAATEGIPGLHDNQLNELVSAKKVMLVIDNDRQLTAYVKGIFASMVVYEASSVAEGWEKVQEVGPDIVICDIMLDESNGIDFCIKLKNSTTYGHIPVILLTGVSSGEMKKAGVECGADDYIIKPFDSDLLQARVHNILKDREVLKRYFFNEITLQSNSLRVSDEYKGFLASCISMVEDNIDRDDFDSKVFAQKMSMSRSRLYAKVKSISGLSVNEFVKLIRLRKAAELMIHTNGQVKEIAFQVGFSDPKYFREQFFNLFKLNPSEYIKKYRDAFQQNSHLSDQFKQAKNK